MRLEQTLSLVFHDIFLDGYVGGLQSLPPFSLPNPPALYIQPQRPIETNSFSLPGILSLTSQSAQFPTVPPPSNLKVAWRGSCPAQRGQAHKAAGAFETASVQILRTPPSCEQWLRAYHLTSQDQETHCWLFMGRCREHLG